MWCFGSGRRRTGRGWTSWAVGFHHLCHVWTDSLVGVLSLYNTNDTTEYKCLIPYKMYPFLINSTIYFYCYYHDSEGDSRGWQMSCKLTVLRKIQRLVWDRWAEGLCLLLEEEGGVFDANGKCAGVISTLDNPVFTCILYCGTVRHTLLGHGAVGQKSAEMINYDIPHSPTLYIRIWPKMCVFLLVVFCL